eukprot:9467245-Pyramimonas_sp.AAC.1
MDPRSRRAPGQASPMNPRPQPRKRCQWTSQSHRTICRNVEVDFNVVFEVAVVVEAVVVVGRPSSSSSVVHEDGAKDAQEGQGGGGKAQEGQGASCQGETLAAMFDNMMSDLETD